MRGSFRLLPVDGKRVSRNKAARVRIDADIDLARRLSGGTLRF